jgi:C-terminal processing protease CtpA/Prc
MLAHVVDEPLPLSAWRTRIYRPTFRAWQRDDAWAWEDGGSAVREPADGEPYDGPIMVLSSARTYSAAEDFLVAFRQADRGHIIGQASGGSTGQPLRFPLPGGGSARICSKRDSFSDGTDFVGVGIRPDIEVAPTVADIRAGRDPVLERAVAEIEAEPAD